MSPQPGLGLDTEELTFAAALAHYTQGLLDEGEGGPAAEKALEAFSAAAGLDPSSPRIHARLAIKALIRGKPDEAIDALKRSCEANPDSLKAWLDLARTCQIVKRSDEAVQYYRRALALSPENEQILAEIADILFEQKKDGEALAIVESGIPDATQESVLVAMCHNQGRKFILAGESQRAIGCFRLLARKLPANTHQYAYLLGELYRTEKDFKAAIRWYRLATRREDPLPEAFLKLAFLHLEAGAPDRAIRELEQGRSSLPDAPAILLTLAALYVQAERHGEAIPAYEHVRDLAAKTATEAPNATFYLHFGAACERAGQLDKAADVFLEGLEKHPDAAAILNYLAYMWAEAGTRLDEALGYVLKALKIEPDNPAYLDTLGWVYYRQARYPEALEQIARARTLMDSDPTINEHLGDVHLAMGNTDEALACWKNSFLLDPQNEAVADKLRTRGIQVKKLRKQAADAAR